MNTDKNEDIYNPAICCFCRSTEYDEVVKGPVIDILRCRNCSFMRQGFSSSRQKDFSFTSYAGNNERFIRQREDKERIQISDFKQIVNELDKYMPNKGSLLEIGSAMGATLNEFHQAGWDTVGLEPEEWTCNQARKKYGLNYINAKFQDADLEKESFDVVIMLHVIEHLPDPFEGLQYILDLLKPGGILVLETPRYDTITFKILKGRERSVIPGHLHYYTQKTLRMQTEKAGFKELKQESVGRTVTLDRLSFYAAKLLNTDFTTKMISNMSDFLKLNKVSLHINLHDMTRAYLQKP